MYSTLISAEQLLALQAQGGPLRVFDCSADLFKTELGRQQFEQEHLPGAVHADIDKDLSDKSGADDAASGGRHPLPSREKFADWLRSVGVDQAMQVVVYDRQGALFCGRLWWMLKWCGHEAVAMLDGGLAAWQEVGGSLESGAAKTGQPGNFRLGPQQAALRGRSEVARDLDRDSQTLIDARAAPRYRGEIEPIDPVAGHIPGALNRPFQTNLDAEGRFKPAALLRQEFETLLAGRDPATVVHQCGSGVSAIPNLISMELAGLGRTTLYAGSWSDWCRDPSLPVAKG